MRALIACEMTGETRDALRAVGIDAWSVDLQADMRASPFHIQGDALEVAHRPGWDFMLAHPPCTFLTNSAAWAYKDGPYHQQVKPGTLVGAARRAARVEAFDFFMALVHAPIPKIAIENPVGAVSTLWRPADQIIQPYDFGDDASKATGLWLKGLPRLRPTKFVSPRWICCGIEVAEALGKYGCPNCCGDEGPAKPRWSNQTNSGQNKLSPSDDRAQRRADTYPGIASAIAAQWGQLLLKGNT